MGREGGYEPLFRTRRETRRVRMYRVFAATVFGCVCWIWVYRLSHIPKTIGNGILRLVWVGMLGSELWFGLYWLITQAPRWNSVHRFTFKDRLSQRYESVLPKVDVFVCTADPEIEPPLMVANTVLSVMSLDYPSEKLSIYLSDDGGSQLTFYALLEASKFAKHWIPFCKKFSIEPTSPAAYFSTQDCGTSWHANDFGGVKKLYEEMANRIESSAKFGVLPEVQSKHKNGFSQWESYSSRCNHGTILQILLDGRKDANNEDIEGNALPSLVYLAREKRPQYPHNFKAGAINALIRVSSKISCGEIILNLDCDMYSNNSQSLRDALCFFMDEERGDEIAFVQFPQCFENITRNDLYSNKLLISMDVEFHGLDDYGGPLYVGTGCFHRRDTLCGRKYGEKYQNNWKTGSAEEREERSEEKLKILASCTYEEDTQWGKEMGLKYGCPVEDVITGLAIQRRGWKSVYFNPERKAFIGVAPNTLLQSLVQHKRWSEGDFQVLLSKCGPVSYAQGKMRLGLRLGYCCYCLWAPSSLAVIYYAVIPSLYLLVGIPLFPEGSSLFTLPFAYVIITTSVYGLAEFLFLGGTLRSWWNDYRMWLYRRESSYLFGFIDTVLQLLGYSDSAFVITAKVAEEDEAERYEKEIMEFGAESPMFVVLATFGLINLFCFAGAAKRWLLEMDHQKMGLQFLLCGALVLINLPLYEALFLRKDKGKMPSSVTVKSVVLALSICFCFSFIF